MYVNNTKIAGNAASDFCFVIPERFERSTHSLEGCCSIQLSYETILISLHQDISALKRCKITHFWWLVKIYTQLFKQPIKTILCTLMQMQGNFIYCICTLSATLLYTVSHESCKRSIGLQLFKGDVHAITPIVTAICWHIDALVGSIGAT